MRRLRFTLTMLAAGALLILASAQSASAAVSVDPMKTWQVAGTVDAIAYGPGTLYVGGSFTSILPPRATSGGESRSNFAAFSSATGQPIEWTQNPAITGTVRAIAVYGQTVYLGGSFSVPDPANPNVVHKNLVAVDATSGTVEPWRPRLSAAVGALAVSPDGSRLYVGGSFKEADGQSRLHLAAFDTATGTLDPNWAPNPDGSNTYLHKTLQSPRVNSLALSADGSKLYVGGVFTSIGSNQQARNNGAAVRTTGAGRATRFDPALKDYVVLTTDVSSNGRTVCFGGRGPGGFVAGYHSRGGSQRWYHRLDGDVQAAAVAGPLLYIGGHFQNVSDIGVPRGHLAAFQANTGTLDSWDARANSNHGVFAVATDPTHVAIGGTFTRVNSLLQQGFAEFAG